MIIVKSYTNLITKLKYTWQLGIHRHRLLVYSAGGWGVFFNHYAHDQWNAYSNVFWQVRLDTFMGVRYGTQRRCLGRKETVLSLTRHNPTRPDRERAKPRTNGEHYNNIIITLLFFRVSLYCDVVYVGRSFLFCVHFFSIPLSYYGCTHVLLW